MSLPLDEPLHAKFLRRAYPPGFLPLFMGSPLANRLGVLLSVGIAVFYGVWSGTIGEGHFDDRTLNWGDYPGFWLGFYWHQGVDLFAQHPDLVYLQSTAPLGVKGLYFLLAHSPFPLPIVQMVLSLGLAMAIAALSFGLTLTVLPSPLAGTIASVLTLQSLWTPEHPLVPEPQTWGYLGVLLCLYALNNRGFSGVSPAIAPISLTQLPRSAWLDWLKQIYWPLMGGIVFLELFFPTYLWIMGGILFLQMLQRLAIVPGQSKPQTVQEFLDWTKEQQRRKQELRERLEAQKSKNKGQKRSPKISKKPKNIEWIIKIKSPRILDIYLPSLGLILCLAILHILLQYWGNSSFSRIEMIEKSDFYPGGLWAFFYHEIWQVWFLGKRSGFIPFLSPPLLWIGLALPLWLTPWGLRQFPLLRHLTSSGLEVLKELLIASWVCFVLAHALVLQMGWPQDFVILSDRIVLTIATGVFLSAIIETITQGTRRSQDWPWPILMVLIIGILTFKFSFISFTPPANLLPPRPTSALYGEITKIPEPKVMISTLGFRGDLPLHDRDLLKALQNLDPFYRNPDSLSPFNKVNYNAQKQQLQTLIQAQYLDSESDFLRFLNVMKGKAEVTLLWILESDTFSSENWRKYDTFKYLYPNLSRRISQNFSHPNASKVGFLQTFIDRLRNNHSSCLLEADSLMTVNLSDRCLDHAP